MGNELSSLTTDDLKVQFEYLQRTLAEETARKLLKYETSIDTTYGELIAKGDIGFMHAYIKSTADVKTLTTRADRDVVISLAKCDLLKGSFSFFFVFQSIML